jgi:NADH:ubiquinone oxidoreductase subunit 6 (subunit J)
MLSWIFSVIALGAALTATVVTSMQRAILSLWIAGLAMGCLFLTLGAETIAILQWIISTLVAIALFFFAVMFGEYERETKNQSLFNRKFIVSMILATVLGAAFAFIIYLGASEFPSGQILTTNQVNDLSSLGKVIVENHIVSLEVLGLTLFLVLVGGGVVARPESIEIESGEKESGDNACS